MLQKNKMAKGYLPLPILSPISIARIHHSPSFISPWTGIYSKWNFLFSSKWNIFFIHHSTYNCWSLIIALYKHTLTLFHHLTVFNFFPNNNKTKHKPTKMSQWYLLTLIIHFDWRERKRGVELNWPKISIFSVKSILLFSTPPPFLLNLNGS